MIQGSRGATVLVGMPGFVVGPSSWWMVSCGCTWRGRPIWWGVLGVGPGRWAKGPTTPHRCTQMDRPFGGYQTRNARSAS